MTAALEKEGRGDIMIVVGGVIPPADYPALYAAGAKAVFGPGTNIPRAAADLLEKLNAELGYEPQGGGGVRLAFIGLFDNVIAESERGAPPVSPWHQLSVRQLDRVRQRLSI